jgi:hypothetical protein
MSKSEAEQYVRSHEDEDMLDMDDLIACYRALYDEDPDPDDSKATLWSHCCARVL